MIKVRRNANQLLSVLIVIVGFFNTHDFYANTSILEGTWVKPCGIATGMSPNEPRVYFDVVSLTFTANRFLSSVKNFTNAACTSVLILSPNPTAMGRFWIGKRIKSVGGYPANLIRSHIQKFNGESFNRYEYSIFYINNNKLQFGKEKGSLDASSVSRRPTILDISRVFIKKNIK